ncbi:MAG: N-acetylmuramoyl-L-alanine amidase [Cyanobacteria bacterium P01_H01_bin.119]
MIRCLTAWATACTTATLLGGWAIAAAAHPGHVETEHRLTDTLAQSSVEIPPPPVLVDGPTNDDAEVVPDLFNSSSSEAANTRYQVIVPITDLDTPARVKAVQPSAFSTVHEGQSVMQAGLYRDRRWADAMVQQLLAVELEATVVAVEGNATVGQSGSPSENPPSENPVVPPPAETVQAYRVIVPGDDLLTLSQVREVQPSAFRATVNGQRVIQAGIYQESRWAEAMRQQLADAGLTAQIVTSTSPIPAPIAQPTPSPIPQSGIVVMIDPGHGGRDPGAIGIGGIYEKDINLAIATRVQQILVANGIDAPITRTGDQTVELDPRVRMGNRANADLFVSIHANAISLSRPEVNGLETYYYSTGYSLARTIHNSILQQVDMRDRGVRQARFYVLRYSDAPAVLVETGFVTGAEDVVRLRDPAQRNIIADAIAQGILNYIRTSL